MSRAQINRLQIRQKEVNLDLVDTTTAGKALITKLIVGDGFQSTSTGVDAGTGEVSISLSGNLQALSNLNSTGIIVRGTNGMLSRSIQGTTGNITVTNGDGLNGNPTVDLADNGVAPGNYRAVTVDAKGRVTAGLSSYEYFVANEMLVSTDGIVYTLAHTPITNTLMVWVQGNKQTAGADRDFTVDGNVITFTTPNPTNLLVTAAYFHGSAFVADFAKFDVILARVGNEASRFQIPDTYLDGSLMIFLNGQLQVNDIAADYTVDSGQVVFNYTIQQDDIVTASYFLA